MGMKFEYEGTVYNVPCIPKKEWGEWMTAIDHLCGRSMKCACHIDDCEKCIYASYQEANAKARKAFYYECFPEEKPEKEPSCEECANYKPKEELKKFPKLTQEVFEREDCPEWAKWAAVDKDGKASWFEKRPTVCPACWIMDNLMDNNAWIEGKFDASDWQHSLLEKAKKFRYKILEMEDRNKLEALVSSFLEQGWKLKGGATKCRKSYTQTLIKEV